MVIRLESVKVYKNTKYVLDVQSVQEFYNVKVKTHIMGAYVSGATRNTDGMVFDRAGLCHDILRGLGLNPNIFGSIEMAVDGYPSGEDTYCITALQLNANEYSDTKY